MAIGSLQELIVDGGWDTDTGYKGETTWATLNGTTKFAKLMVLEDGFGVDITNATLQSEYKHGTLDPTRIRRIAMDVGGPCNIHLHPAFARFALDMCMLRASSGEQDSYGYTMYYNTSLDSGERETRKILGSKVNTFTISASNDAQEVLTSMEMIAKTCEYNTEDWARDTWDPKSPYLFVDGDAFLRAYDVAEMLSPFSPWSPIDSIDKFSRASVSGFSIEGNNNLRPGPYKRSATDPALAYIQSLKAGRLQLNGSFALDYEKSDIDYEMLENFSHGELVLNFMCPGQTGYAIDKATLTPHSNTFDYQNAGEGNTHDIAKYDIVIIIGTIGGSLVSEVFQVSARSNDTVTMFTYGDTDANMAFLPHSPSFGVRHDWANNADADPKIYNYAMQLWIPTFKITDAPKPGAPQETQSRTVNFIVAKPDIHDNLGASWTDFEQIQYLAPAGTDPTDIGAAYFVHNLSIS